jgi:hypothetical protein
MRERGLDLVGTPQRPSGLDLPTCSHIKKPAPVVEQQELWNRLDPGTAALQDRPYYWLLVTDREAHQMYLGDVPPRVKVALQVMLTEILRVEP